MLTARPCLNGPLVVSRRLLQDVVPADRDALQEAFDRSPCGQLQVLDAGMKYRRLTVKVRFGMRRSPRRSFA